MKRRSELKRGAPITRTPMQRGGKVRPRNVARRNREWARAYGSAERVAFVASLPCLAAAFGCGGGIENAHVCRGDGGMGRKASARYIAPVCNAHHGELHRGGPETFSRRYSLDLEAAAARTEALWQQRCAA